ncbi:MAG: hypothetical protein QGG14_10635 [Planctomycetota bacterium]|nr:hypothetical protein [Planctomycetota bacterium]
MMAPVKLLSRCSVLLLLVAACVAPGSDEMTEELVWAPLVARLSSLEHEVRDSGLSDRVQGRLVELTYAIEAAKGESGRIAEAAEKNRIGIERLHRRPVTAAADVMRMDELTRDLAALGEKIGALTRRVGAVLARAARPGAFDVKAAVKSRVAAERSWTARFEALTGIVKELKKSTDAAVTGAPSAGQTKLLSGKLNELERQLAATSKRSERDLRDLAANVGKLEARLTRLAKRPVAETTSRTDLWSEPWVWSLGLLALFFLALLLFRGDREAGEGKQDVLPVPATPVAQEEATREPAEKMVDHGSQPAAAPARVAARPANGEPAPRVQTLRIPAEDTGPGGEAAVRSLLECDPRVLVEPSPRIEPHGDGSVSIRFYVRGSVGQHDAANLAGSCRSLAAGHKGS